MADMPPQIAILMVTQRFVLSAMLAARLSPADFPAKAAEARQQLVRVVSPGGPPVTSSERSLLAAYEKEFDLLVAIFQTGDLMAEFADGKPN